MRSFTKVLIIIFVFTLPVSFAAAEQTPAEQTVLTTSMTAYLALFDEMLKILDENEEYPVEAEKQFSEYQQTHEKEMEKLLETIQTEADADIELKKIFSREFQTAMGKVLTKLRKIALAAEKKQAEEKENEKKALPKEL